jgi:Flp pilus assembly protein TadG
MKTKTERGQSLVELAISLVVLLFLLAGIVEFGLAFFQFVQLRDAAQEGALYGSTEPSDVIGIRDRVKHSSDTPIDLPSEGHLQGESGGAVTIMVSIDGIPYTDTANYATVDCETHALTVRVEYDHHVFMPFMSEIIGSTVPLNATVTDTILSPYTCTP